MSFHKNPGGVVYQDPEYDPILKPRHYNAHPSGIECIEITRHMNFNLGNAVKYLWRAGLKGNAIDDLKKALWYLADEITRIQKTESHPSLTNNIEDFEKFDLIFEHFTYNIGAALEKITHSTWAEDLNFSCRHLETANNFIRREIARLEKAADQEPETPLFPGFSKQGIRIPDPSPDLSNRAPAAGPQMQALKDRAATSCATPATPPAQEPETQQEGS